MSITQTHEFMTRKEAAEYIRGRWHQRVSAQTLALYAHKKKGPPYVKTETGKDVFYKRDDLDTWATNRLLPGHVAANGGQPIGALAVMGRIRK